MSVAVVIVGVGLSSCGNDSVPSSGSGGASGGLSEPGPATGGHSPSGGHAAIGGGHNGSTGGIPSASGGNPASGGDVGSFGGAGGSGSEGGVGGDINWSEFETPPSCAGLDGTECSGDDCCESLVVPGGMATDNEGMPAELRTFRLDKYEVTVVRFRAYMEAVEAWRAAGNPIEGAGAHPDEPNSGWRGDWVGQIEAFGFGTAVIDGIVPTWWEGANPSRPITPTYPVPGSDALAVNHIPFIAAYAFCIWDGGRLPTRMEWLYAARGGEAETQYPWGNSPKPSELIPELPPTTVARPDDYDEDYWRYAGIPVGSNPASAGIFGHQDLQAGVSEYIRDTNPEGMHPEVAPSVGRLIELGGDETAAGQLSPYWPRMIVQANWSGRALAPDPFVSDGVGSDDVGFRCARDR